MIIKGKDVIGLNVVTVDTGTIVETVDDIAYDPTNQRIVALLVDSGGLFSSAKAIHMDDVHNIGEDAVIVHDASVIKTVKELGDDVRSISEGNKHLVKTNVLTSEGKNLGKVTDIFFDSASGVVDSMEVSQGGLKNMTEGKKAIRPADIVTIGADATIVSAYTELKFEAQGQEGGFKGAFNDAKDKATEIAADVKDKASDIATDAREKTEKFTAEAKETTQDITEKASAKAKELAETTRSKVEDLRDQTAEKADQAGETIKQKTAETRRAAAEAANDIRERSEDFVAKTKVQAEDARQRIATEAEKVADAARDEADDLKQRAQSAGKQAHAKAKDTTTDVRRIADRMADKTKEGIKNGSEDIKATARDTRSSNNHSGGKVVKETAQRYEDRDTLVETKKTVIKK